MSGSGPREGGCLCGAVRYVASDVPDHLHACHCTICRKISGSATISVNVPYAAMRIAGGEHVVFYSSSDWATRSFCGRCGSGLWYRLNGVDADYIISAGTLDDLRGLMLTKEIYVETKPDGYAFAGDHPRLTGAEFEATLNASAGDL
ncbi:MAG: GFA family protein [Paracoccaceae bacterium]